MNFIKKVLLALKFYKERKVYGQLQVEEGNALYKCAKKFSPKVLLEIGSYKGKSANFFLRGMSHDAILHCVDTWQNDAMTEGKYNTYDIFQNNLPIEKRDQVVMHRGTSDEMSKVWDGTQLDLLFIDGDHSKEAVESDFNNWSKFVKKGGLILFHDYTNPCGVKEVVEGLIAKGTIQKIDLVKSLYISRLQ